MNRRGVRDRVGLGRRAIRAGPVVIGMSEPGDGLGETSPRGRRCDRLGTSPLIEQTRPCRERDKTDSTGGSRAAVTGRVSVVVRLSVRPIA